MAKIRVAAVADVHCYEEVRLRLRAELTAVNDHADLLVLPGDLTLIGQVCEARILAEELGVVRVPIVAVLGNHDYHMNADETIVRMLNDVGVHVLDGQSVTLRINGSSIGIAGVKGFCGGFGRRLIAEFGEPQLKAFVQAGREEEDKLRAALNSLDCDHRVVLVHYSPIKETLIGESPELYPFLGSSGLAEPIDAIGADVIFHGHAHYGSRSGFTRRGIPVFNVAHPLIRGFIVRTLDRNPVPAHEITRHVQLQS